MVVTIVFLAAAAVAVVFAVLTVVPRDPTKNVLSLVIMSFAMAAVFAILGMDFLAAIQIIVYSGAVLVLFLFVIMLLKIRRIEALGSGRPVQALLGALVAAGIGGMMLVVAGLLLPLQGAVLPGAVEAGTAFPIGRALLSTHLFAFEFITLLLVAAIVGAVYLGKGEEE
ncbi:MAG: NADH-quinone oxidoreductase subunit J [Acidobacteria bacterium]|nr:NADH-quinone oxidoreductase subunit J [Candidatus Sulfomarinibacter sp. MAG AM1]